MYHKGQRVEFDVRGKRLSGRVCGESFSIRTQVYVPVVSDDGEHLYVARADIIEVNDAQEKDPA